jgi:hypothetical protein
MQADCSSMRARLTGDTGTSDAFRQKNLRDITGIKVADEKWVVADTATQRKYYQIETAGISSSYAGLKLQFQHVGPEKSAAFEFEVVYVFIPLSYGGAYYSFPSDGLEAPPSYNPDPFDGSDVPPFVRKEWIAKLKVDSLSFFAGSRGSLNRDALPRATSFNRDDVKNIYWEMTLRSSSPSPGADVEVECVYHDTGGDFLGKDRFTTAFPKDRDILKFWGEFATNNHEVWSTGSYSMEVLLDGRFVERKEFEVEH